MNLGLTLIITTLAEAYMLGLPALFCAAAHCGFKSTMSRCMAVVWLAVYLSHLAFS
jgi:hypothetical protein